MRLKVTALLIATLLIGCKRSQKSEPLSSRSNPENAAIKSCGFLARSTHDKIYLRMTHDEANAFLSPQDGATTNLLSDRVGKSTCINANFSNLEEVIIASASQIEEGKETDELKCGELQDGTLKVDSGYHLEAEDGATSNAIADLNEKQVCVTSTFKDGKASVPSMARIWENP